MPAFLEDYTKIDEIGSGGYATVYKVRHNQLDYIRAIRVLDKTISSTKDKLYLNFLEECKLLLRLGNGNHPNIVHIYQPLFKANKAFVEMDFIDGLDLARYIKEKSFIEIEEVLLLVEEISSALAYCHHDIYKFCYDKERDNLEDDPNYGVKPYINAEIEKRLVEKYRVIHNDIHAGNIMRRENGHYVLLDFGLAIEGSNIIRSSKRRNGAPEYKSPEKWENEDVISTESDIYSLGVVLYEFLTGRVPFQYNQQNSNQTEAEHQLFLAHKKQNPPSIYEERKKTFEKVYPGKIYQKDYPDWLEKLIMRCLEKKPKDRFHDGKELYEFVKNEKFKKKSSGPTVIDKIWDKLRGKDKDSFFDEDFVKHPQSDMRVDERGKKTGDPFFDDSTSKRNLNSAKGNDKDLFFDRVYCKEKSKVTENRSKKTHDPFFDKN